MPNLLETQVNTHTDNAQYKPFIAALEDGGWVVTWRSYLQDGSLNGVYSQVFNADGTSQGSETQVNTYVSNHQFPRSITALNDGGWVITWTSLGQDGDGWGIYTQAYNSDGSPRGNETQVNSFTTGAQEESQTSALSDGGWLITWISDGQDGSLDGIYSQAFNSDGTPRGVETQVNSFTAGSQQAQQVAVLSDGGWVITWQSFLQDGSGDGIYQQVYNADGTAQGIETQVNSYTSSVQHAPQVTALSDGGWVVVWVSSGQDGSGFGIYSQVYNADGSQQGNETRVNTYTANNQDFADVVALPSGGWVVTWVSIGQDGNSYGVFSQAYNADGTTLGAETQVNTYTTSVQFEQQITVLSDGGWVITWNSYAQDGDASGIFSQRYGADGLPLGSEIQVNTYTTGTQNDPQITALRDGGWVVTWNSTWQDGDDLGIYQQAYNADGSTTDGSFIASTALGAQQLYSGSGIVTQTGSVASTSGTAIGAIGSVEITVSGDVIASNGDAIEMSGAALALTVGSSGNILSSSDSGLSANAYIEASIINAGVISGGENGIFLGSSTGGSTVLNSGTISGASHAIIGTQDDGSGSSDVIFNSGTLMGDVDLRSGDDLFDGRAGQASGAVFGGGGEDRLIGGDNDDTLHGENDNDVLRGRKGDDLLSGGEGRDKIRGQNDDDTIEGNQGHDLLFGGRGDDEINGGTGSDTIKGGTGNDLLTGGTGADVFVFRLSSGFDEITDFNNNTDKLDITAFNMSSRSEVYATGAIIADGDGSIIDLRLLGGDGVIYVEDMSVAQWSNSDFLF